MKSKRVEIIKLISLLRVALLAVAKEASYLVALCDHLNADSTDSEKDIALSASNLKVGVGFGIYLKIAS